MGQASYVRLDYPQPYEILENPTQATITAFVHMGFASVVPIKVERNLQARAQLVPSAMPEGLPDVKVGLWQIALPSGEGTAVQSKGTKP